MGRKLKICGGELTKMRRQRKWTRNEVVARANSLGFDISNETIAGLEAGSLPMTEKQTAILVEIFDQLT